jgi:hypothetical protein
LHVLFVKDTRKIKYNTLVASTSFSLSVFKEHLSLKARKEQQQRQPLKATRRTQQRKESSSVFIQQQQETTEKWENM